MTTKELRQKSPSELRSFLREEEIALVEISRNLSSGKEKNTSLARSKRRSIARAQTVLSQMKILNHE